MKAVLNLDALSEGCLKDHDRVIALILIVTNYLNAGDHLAYQIYEFIVKFLTEWD